LEILGRGFGDDPFDLNVVGSARVAGRDQLTVPFHVLSASDTRILARVGYVPPGTPGGPIQVYRGVGNEGTPQVADSKIEFLEPIRTWREGTPSSSFTLTTVYEPPHFSAPPEECFQSGPPVQGVLNVYLYEWFPNAVVSFNSHVSAAFASGSASVSASGVRFLGGGDLLEGAQRLAEVLEAAFAQQAGLIVNAEATRPQEGTVKLTLSLPNGFITGGFLNVCVEEGETIWSVAEVFPPIFAEGDLVTIKGNGFGNDTRDLRVGLKDESEARLLPMEVLRATDTQILARMGPAPPDFTQSPIEVARGRGYYTGQATVWEGFSPISSAVAAAVTTGHTGLTRCYHSWRNSSAFPPFEDLDQYLEPHLVLTPHWDYPVEITIRALVHSFPPASTAFEKTFHLPANNHWQDNANRIADAFEAAVGEAGFILQMSLDGVTVNDPDPPNPQSVRFAALMAPYYWGGPPAVMGSFSICVRATPREIQLAQAMASGNLVILSGSGFGDDADQLSVALADGRRLIPLRLLSASDTQLTARMETVPPDARPGPIVVARGKKSLNVPQPFFDDTTIGSAGAWLGREASAVSAQLVTPAPAPSQPGRQWFFGEPPADGELFVMLGGDWPNGAIISIAAGIHDANGAAYELNVPTVRFAQAGNPLDCAERIADVIRSGFWQQAALAVDVKTTPLPGGQVKLSLSLLDGFVRQGFVTICVNDPALRSQMNIRTLSRHVEVSWTGFGVLEMANQPGGPWREVAPAPMFSPHFEPALPQAVFYRLRR